jgi:hypothetical protein
MNHGQHLCRISSAIATIGFWNPWIDCVSQSKVGDEHTHTACCQRLRNRGADAVVSTGHQRDMTTAIA